MLSESELRAHLARLLRDAHVTFPLPNGHFTYPAVSVADAANVIARWITQQQSKEQS